MLPRNKVLGRRPTPTKNSYRAAIKKIVLAIQSEHQLNDPDLAERIGCSGPTIANARNERANLDGVTLARIEHEFGPAALDPFLELGGSRAVPLAAAPAVDAHATLPLADLLCRLIEAQKPDSDGGITVTRDELVRALPALRDARTVIDAMIEIADGPQLRAVATG